VLEVEDTGLAAADILDRAEEAEHSLVGACCNSLFFIILFFILFYYYYFFSLFYAQTFTPKTFTNTNI